MSRVPGHELIREGAPFEANGRSSYPARWGSGTGGTGRGKCSCGALSEVLDSGAARKNWHRRHKDSVAASGPSSDAEQKGLSPARLPLNPKPDQ